jgi:hypothetical protein
VESLIGKINFLLKLSNMFKDIRVSSPAYSQLKCGVHQREFFFREIWLVLLCCLHVFGKMWRAMEEQEELR